MSEHDERHGAEASTHAATPEPKGAWAAWTLAAERRAPRSETAAVVDSARRALLGALRRPGRSLEEVDGDRLERALAALEQAGPRTALVVELRFFGGLDEREIGRLLQLDGADVRLDWEVARLWLRRALDRGEP